MCPTVLPAPPPSACAALGSERKLVLVNGRRLVRGDPTLSAADLNVIPASLIQRVDLLTGGASSV